MDEQPVFRGEFAFSYKTVRTHLLDFISRPLPILAVTVAIFGVLWTFGEASIQFTGASPRGWLSYALLIAVSGIASVLWNGYLYFQRVPEGFDHVSTHAQRIAHLQRPLWEFHLAKALLSQKLAPFERELADMEAGRQFVVAENPESLQAYIRWADARNENLFTMLAVAEQLILNDFPAALQSTAQRPADPKKTLDAVETLARFYGETVAFERSSRAVVPSEDLNELHQLQLGWSESIRDGVRQLFQFLQQMCEYDPDGENRIKFEIVFDEPAKVSRYCEELDRLKEYIPDLESNW